MVKIHNNIFGEQWFLMPVINSIDRLVQISAQNVYNLSALAGNNRKYNQWSSEALEFIENKRINNLIYAKYGYAVEECTNLNMWRINFPTGYTYRIQDDHGETRPDIVICQKTELLEALSKKAIDINSPLQTINFLKEDEIAWLDITSEDSENHIENKKGTRWKTTPFVAELLYPRFDPSNITLGSGVGIAERASALYSARRIENEKKKLLDYMIKRTNEVLRRISEMDKYSKKILADLFAQVLRVNLQSMPSFHPAIKSILKKYSVCYGARHIDTAKYLLKLFYSSSLDSQNWGLAKRILIDSYNITIPNERIYLNQAEIDEILGN